MVTLMRSFTGLVLPAKHKHTSEFISHLCQSQMSNKLKIRALTYHTHICDLCANCQHQLTQTGKKPGPTKSVISLLLSS